MYQATQKRSRSANRRFAGSSGHSDVRPVFILHGEPVDSVEHLEPYIEIGVSSFFDIEIGVSSFFEKDALTPINAPKVGREGPPRVRRHQGRLP
jgi:hypothetical protein